MNDRIEAALDIIGGDRQFHRDTLADPAAIVAKVCQEAAWRAKRRGTTIKLEMQVSTGYGPKVAQAIYEVYGKRPGGS